MSKTDELRECLQDFFCPEDAIDPDCRKCKHFSGIEDKPCGNPDVVGILFVCKEAGLVFAEYKDVPSNKLPAGAKWGKWRYIVEEIEVT